MFGLKSLSKESQENGKARVLEVQGRKKAIFLEQF